MSSGLPETKRLLKVVGELRARCPWDKKQTHRSLVRYLIEEAYETVDAIQGGSAAGMQEELGDLLLQIALHAEIAGEKKKFRFEDVARGITEKMIRRHPHIYGNRKYKDLKTHLKTWTQLKSEEKPKRNLLEGIPKALPGLQLAQRYGEIASSVGFDWSDSKAVMKKVREEMGELEAELKKKKAKSPRVEEELGDLFFSLANLARHLGLDADAVARRGALKFGGRFTKLERGKRKQGKRLQDCPLPELDAAWDRLKKSR